MSLQWIEDTRGSQSATIFRIGKRASSTRTRIFKVFGTSSETTLHTECNTYIGTTMPYWQYPGGPAGIYLRAESYSVEYLGDQAWQVSINYEHSGADGGDSPSKRVRSFDTGGGTQHVTNAIGNAAVSGDYGERYYKRPVVVPFAPLPDRPQYGAVGVSDNGVDGVDIVSPQLQWTEQYDVPSTYVTSTYIKGVAKITGTTNDAAFRTFAIGEILFLGCTGSQTWDTDSGNGPWSLSYKFAASPNCGTGLTLPAIQIGDIAGVKKLGWEYMWIRYEAASENSSIVKKPAYVYVDKVYNSSDFSTLGIGTT